MAEEGQGPGRHIRQQACRGLVKAGIGQGNWQGEKKKDEPEIVDCADGAAAGRGHWAAGNLSLARALHVQLLKGCDNLGPVRALLGLIGNARLEQLNKA